MPHRDLGRPLLRLARDAIAAEFGLPAAGIPSGASPDRVREESIPHGEASDRAGEALNRAGATFVTLTQSGESCAAASDRWSRCVRCASTCNATPSPPPSATRASRR